MSVRKTLKAEQGFLDEVFTEVEIANFVHYYRVTKIKEGSQRKKKG